MAQTNKRSALDNELRLRATLARVAPERYEDCDSSDARIDALMQIAIARSSARQKLAARALWTVATDELANAGALQSLLLRKFVVEHLQAILTGTLRPEAAFRVARRPGPRRRSIWRAEEEAYFLVDYYHRSGLAFGHAINRVVEEDPGLKDVLNKRPSVLREAIRRYRRRMRA